MLLLDNTPRDTSDLCTGLAELSDEADSLMQRRPWAFTDPTG